MNHMMEEDITQNSDSLDDLYAAVVRDMADAAKQAGVIDLTPQRAHAAARNFIGFCQTLLEIERERGQSSNS